MADREVDRPATMSSRLLRVVDTIRTEKRAEREKSAGSGSSAKEIIAKYRKPEDATSAAALARNKLVERQDKLEKLSKNSEELEGRSKDYASLATKLAEKMEKRKWWQL
ncbi:hypothetical protein K2173_000074 [Erythroxylum novogranatense]|uniref:V-SNARE coiled-coil homology domain-containing protein n=1 Tax=Erythroxylum novogranatense TaxID=1862640 RepID=A0AAV8SNJ4_9ROSI|nr:hypothetical protein K2173_000074 [Erythroxylum novogranatense]